jgi:hypothetical protein
MTLAQAERLAELHLKRQRCRELEESAWKLVGFKSQHEDRMRVKAKIYRAASRLLYSEINRLEEEIVNGTP